jgi:hypothetical protein
MQVLIVLDVQEFIFRMSGLPLKGPFTLGVGKFLLLPLIFLFFRYVLTREK